jgi:hypothetical protein
MALNNLLQAGRRPREKPPAPRTHVSRWPAIVALLALGMLSLALPEDLTLGPRWLLLALEVPVLAFLATARRVELPVDPRVLHWMAVGLLAVATVLIGFSIGYLLNSLVTGKGPQARRLLGDAGALWCANVLIFALWFWETDQGGPHRRREPNPPPPDLLFPQQSGPGIGAPDWHPRFLDYLFVAFTNATAFSPTDTLPLTRRIKVLMMIEAICSVLMVAILAGRAVNIL